MACSQDFVQYIADNLNDAGKISFKKMMGDYCIYCNEILFGLICDNKLYIKSTKSGEKILKSVKLIPPYPGAKNYFYIEDLDNRDYLVELVKTTCNFLSINRKKKK